MFERVTYKEMLLNLREFENWLGQLRINTKSSRLEEVISCIDNLSISWENGRLEQLISSVDGEYLYYRLSEANAFIYVYNSLKALPDDKIPRKLLKEIILGPFLASDEVPGGANVNNRNFLFEIEMAAKLASKDLKITGFDDVQFTYEHYNFAMQCKRLISSRNIAYNVEKAYGQLKPMLNERNNRGIIALSIEKIIEADKNLLVVDNVGEIQPKIVANSLHFINEHSWCWKKIVHPKVIAVFILTKFLAHIKDINLLTTVYHIDIVPLCTPSAGQVSDYNLLKRLGAVLHR